jgi:hypothetical protein
MKASALPFGYVLGVLTREQAAEYVGGVGVSLFDAMVAHGRMPPAVILSVGRIGWVQRELDLAIAALPRKDHIGSIPQNADILEKLDAARKAAKAEKHAAER